MILLIDDEAQFLQSAAFALRSAGHGAVQTCSDSRQAVDLLERHPASVVLLDIQMPHVTGRDLLPRIVERHPGTAVIMVTAVNEVECAVACMKDGAYDYLVKPVDKSRLITAVARALEWTALQSENRRLTQSLLSPAVERPEAFGDIITVAASMEAIFRYIEAIAPTPLPVLITGETGTGKELVARAVHAAAKRAGEFVAVNVGGLDDNLFTDTLFGHEKGAYTGADRARAGLVGTAAGGTLFLDEIGDLKAESQLKLLRLIEEKTYYPIGSDSALRTDARLVVATNAAIAPGAAGSTFRKDLYYRLQSHHIRIPPLRERREDLAPLLAHFLRAAAQEMGKKPPTAPPELAVLLGAYDFPGNVRELRGMVYDAVTRHEGGVLSMESFRAHIGAASGAASVPGQSARTPPAPISFGTQLPTLKQAEDALVGEAMSRAQGNQSVAAQMLGITRSALNKRINHPREDA